MTQPAKTQPDRWTPDLIRDEVRRRHLSLRGIALAAGLHEAACRQALHGINRKGADALAEALNIPFDKLFPDGFVQSRRQASVKQLAESRQKRAAPTDKIAARA
ncbi:helix-turn-helix domain-containing protein [Methylobacterium aquaticum]|uniref:helix-turn-helix domain-containing protein n=1 Tax=Methylobacterium aquaticum TaxID=270351 RepID=UPI00193139C1|nr:helix-turn-helix domain-containing protein [Methylobacterium aquaticum]